MSPSTPSNRSFLVYRRHPVVTHRGRVIEWSYGSIANGGKHVDTSGMLRHLVRVETKSDAQEFAIRYGPIGMCRHGLAYAAHPRSIIRVAGTEFPGERSMQSGETSLQNCPWSLNRNSKHDLDAPLREDTEAYIELGRFASAVLRLVESLKRASSVTPHLLKSSDLGNDADWQVVLGYVPILEFPQEIKVDYRNEAVPAPVRDQLFYRWEAVRLSLDSLIGSGGVEMKLNGLNSDRVGLEMRPSPMGELALQILTVISGSTQLSLCEICASPYFPNRSPRKDRINHCDRTSCRKTATRKRAARWRARNANIPSEKEEVGDD